MKKTLAVLVVWTIAFVVPILVGMKAVAFPRMCSEGGMFWQQILSVSGQERMLDFVWTGNGGMMISIHYPQVGGYFTDRYVKSWLTNEPGTDLYYLTRSRETFKRFEGGFLVDFLERVLVFPPGQVPLVWNSKTSGHYQQQQGRGTGAIRVVQVSKIGTFIMTNPPDFVAQYPEGPVFEEPRPGQLQSWFYWFDAAGLSPYKDVLLFIGPNETRRWKPSFQEVSSFLPGPSKSCFGYFGPIGSYDSFDVLEAK